MTPPADSIPPTNPNLGRGRFVARPAPALRPSRAQRRRVWIAWVFGIYLAWFALYGSILAADWYGPIATTGRASHVLSIIPEAMLSATYLTLPILIVWLDIYRCSYISQVRHAKARGRLSRCCLHCRYPIPPQTNRKRRRCPECGLRSPNFLTFRRARFVGTGGWFAALPPADEPALSTAAELIRLLTFRERAECFFRGRALGLSWPLAAIIFALIPTLVLALLCCPDIALTGSRFNPFSLIFGVTIFIMLTFMIRSNARTSFALYRLYSPPFPPTPKPPRPPPPTTQPPPSQEEGGQV